MSASTSPETVFKDPNMPLLFAKNDCGFFLLAGRKFEYGILLHDIGYGTEETKGSFMIQDKRVATYGLTPIKAARSKLTKGLETSEYRSTFRVGGFQRKLELLVSDALAMPGHLEALIAASTLEYTNKPRVGRPKSTPKNPYPVKKTKVATMTEEFRVPKLARTRTGWLDGVVTEYHPEHTHPYRIEWNDNPKMYENCNLEEMYLLTHHFRECDKRRLLDIHGLCWEGNFVDKKNPKCNAWWRLCMRYGHVLRRSIGKIRVVV